MKFSLTRALVIPNLFFFSYWFLALLWYHVGLVERPPLSDRFYFYFGACWACYGLGYMGGLGLRCAGDRDLAGAGVGLTSNLYLGVGVLSAVGSIVIVADLLLGGSGFGKTLIETNAVRMDYSPSIATTLAVPFYGMQLYAIGAYLYCKVRRIKIPVVIAWSTWTIILCRYIQSFLSANRQIFYFGLCWYVLCLLLTWNLRGLSQKLTRLALILVLVLVAGTYVVFIAVKRNDESYLVATTGNLAVRYRVSPEIRDSLVFAGLLQLDDYPSHVFAAIDRILAQAPLFNCDISQFFLWFISAGNRLVGGDRASMPPTEYRLFMDSCNVATYMWPSIFGDGAYCFGIVGFPFFLAVVGYFFGRCYRCFVKVGSFLAFYWFFIIFNYLIMGHMMVVGDVIMNIALLIGGVIFFGKILLRNRMRRGAQPVISLGNGLPSPQALRES